MFEGFGLHSESMCLALEGIDAALRAAGCESHVVGSIWECYHANDVESLVKAISWAWQVTTQP
jgi:hypothetical protein